MNRGIPADAIRTGIGARVDVASRLSIPVQRLDSGRHTISAGLGSASAWAVARLKQGAHLAWAQASASAMIQARVPVGAEPSGSVCSTSTR